MAAGQWERWCRHAGFERDHPYPGSDLGYDGRDLDTGSLEEVDTDEYDVYWQDPKDEAGWVIVTDESLVECEDEA